MNYIWDILIRAKELGREETDLFFAQAKDCSPWYEQSFSCLNETEPGGIIEVNTLYRFASIFQSLLHETPRSILSAYLLDASLHLLANRELLSGIRADDFYVQKLLQEFLRGNFGEKAARVCGTLSRERRRKLAFLLLAQYRTGSSLPVFRKAVTAFFPDALLYQVKDTPQTLLLYLGQRKSEALEMQVRLIADLFLPIQYHLRIFWHDHFGVLGIDATMRLEQIELY